MELWIIIALVVVVFFFFVMKNVGNPTNKTDAMLLREYELHQKRVEISRNVGPEQYKKALKEMSVLTDEMRSRGLLSETDTNDSRIESDVFEDRGGIENEDYEDPENQFKKAVSFAATQDITQCIKWLNKAAKQGHSEAQYMLGFSHIEQKIAPNDVECYMWFRLSANRGNENAQKVLEMLDEKFSVTTRQEAERRAKRYEEENYV